MSASRGRAILSLVMLVALSGLFAESATAQAAAPSPRCHGHTPTPKKTITLSSEQPYPKVTIHPGQSVRVRADGQRPVAYSPDVCVVGPATAHHHFHTVILRALHKGHARVSGTQRVPAGETYAIDFGTIVVD